MNIKTSILWVSFLLALPLVSFGSDGGNDGKMEQDPPPGQGSRGPQGHRGPPREALEACKSKQSGAECSFTTPRGKETGKCWTPDSSKPLACKPAHGPSDQPPGSPL